MEAPKPKSGRSSLVANREIKLTEDDPLKRLKEFCNQGKYHYKINWDRFKNGYMCECTVYYNFKKKTTKVLKKEVFWVETNDLMQAKKTIAAIFLEGIGLGVQTEGEDLPELTEDDPSDADMIGEQLLKMGTQALSGLMAGMQEKSKSWAEMAEEN